MTNNIKEKITQLLKNLDSEFFYNITETTIVKGNLVDRKKKKNYFDMLNYTFLDDKELKNFNDGDYEELIESLTTCLQKCKKFAFLESYQDFLVFLTILDILNNIIYHYHDLFDNDDSVVIEYLTNFSSYFENINVGNTCVNSFEEVHLAMILEYYNKLFFLENFVKAELPFINILKKINFDMLSNINDLYSLLFIPSYEQLKHIPFLYETAKRINHEIEYMFKLLKKNEKLVVRKTKKTRKSLMCFRDKYIAEIPEKLQKLNNDIKNKKKEKKDKTF